MTRAAYRAVALIVAPFCPLVGGIWVGGEIGDKLLLTSASLFGVSLLIACVLDFKESHE